MRTSLSPGISIIIGALLVLVGVVWLGQGIGLIGGSVMTGVTFWSLVGPIVAIGGAWMIWSGLRRRVR